MELKQAIINQLVKGRDNAIGMNQLQQRLGLKGDRKMRIAIAELRHEGHRIGLSLKKPSGYYIIQTIEELDQCLNTLKDYCVSAAIARRDIKVACKALNEELEREKYFIEHPGQLTLNL